MFFAETTQDGLSIVDASRASQGDKLGIILHIGDGGKREFMLSCYGVHPDHGKCLMLNTWVRIPAPLRRPGGVMTRKQRRLYRTFDPRVIDIENAEVLSRDSNNPPRYTLFSHLEITDISFRLKIFFTPPGSEEVAYWQSALA